MTTKPPRLRYGAGLVCARGCRKRHNAVAKILTAAAQQVRAMGELERDAPTSRHIRPELLAAFGMFFPERSQVLRAYYQDIDDRRRRRAGEFEDELRDATAGRLTVEELIERILADERAGELFERAVQEALVTAEERHRRALAWAVASGLLADDEAAIDDAQTIVRAIAALEPAHVRTLLVMARPSDTGRRRLGADHVAAEINASRELAEALIARLTAYGLARDATEFAPMIGPRGPRWEITELGRRVLVLLRSDPPS